MEDAVFEVEGNTAVPTLYAQGPWDPNLMHGGALAALFAHVFEVRSETRDMHLVRLSIDFLRPVAIQPLTFDPSVIREGGRLHLVEAYAYQEGRPVARGNATWVRVAPVMMPEGWDDARQPVAEAPESFDRWYAQGLGKFSEAMDFRPVEGHYYTPGPAAGWLRPILPIVAGRPNTPAIRVAAAADFGHGISAIAPVERLLFVNPDLTISFARRPQGEWVLMRSRTLPTDTGHGIAESELFDVEGRIGRSVQSLFFDTPRQRTG